MDAERNKGKRKECKRIRESFELDLVIKGKPHSCMFITQEKGFVVKIWI